MCLCGGGQAAKQARTERKHKKRKHEVAAADERSERQTCVPTDAVGHAEGSAAGGLPAEDVAGEDAAA